MSTFLVVVLLVLVLGAAIGAAAAAVSLPRAVARMQAEPEDVYLIAFWAVVGDR